MNVQEAIDFVRARGIVLESALGSVPSLAEAIAGEAMHGSWWSHPRGKDIFRITRAVRASGQVLVCRLVAGKVTFVHRRLWPSLARAKDHIDVRSIARIEELHGDSGRHVVAETPFPEWVPPDVALEARDLAEELAYANLRAIAPGVFVSSIRHD
jgi:hypothetical protein